MLPLPTQQENVAAHTQVSAVLKRIPPTPEGGECEETATPAYSRFGVAAIRCASLESAVSRLAVGFSPAILGAKFWNCLYKILGVVGGLGFGRGVALVAEADVVMEGNEWALIAV